MAAAVLRSVSTATAAGTTGSYTVTKPAGVADGDLLVAVHTCDESGVAANLTAPTGWTLSFAQSAFAGSVGVTKVWYRIAASEPTSYSFAIGANGTGTDGQCAILAYTGGTFDSVTPLAGGVGGGTSTATTTPSAPSVTGVVDAQLVCTFLTNGGSVTWTPPSGMTEAVDFASTGAWTSLEVDSLALTSTAATGTKTATPSTARACVTTSFLIRPTAAASGPTAAGSVTLAGGTVTARAAATTAGTVTISGAASATSTAPAAAAGSVTLGGAAVATVPTPPPAPTPTPVVWPLIPQPGARWTWAVGPWSSLPTAELPNATARSLKLALAGTSSASFTVDGTTTDAAQVQELVTDVWCMRNGVTLFRGRVGPTTDDLDGSKHTVSVTAGDYRALLQRRILYDVDTLTYTNTEQTGIGASLIGSTQSHPGGNLYITGVPNTTNVTRTITYPAGQSIGQAIETLSQMDNGFNWDILPTTGQVGQTFRVWASRGDNKERVLSYPGNLVSVRRQVDPGAYANAVRETGGTNAAGNQIAAVSLDASDVATRAEGRWDKQAGDTSLIDAPSLTAHANYDLTNSQTITPAYTVVMQPGEWGGPTDIWLGDAVLLHVSSGRVNVLGEPLRVWEIGIDLDDADNETVTLTLAALDPTKRARARQVDLRLQALERR